MFDHCVSDKVRVDILPLCHKCQHALVLEVIYQDLLDMRTGIARDNLSQEKIRNIKIPVPPLDIQQRLAAEVKQLEAEIAQSQAVIDNSTERKNAILTSYL